MKSLAIEYKVLSYKELEESDAKLMDAAVEAMAMAYAPYSKFTVGSAVLLGNDEVVLGNNQENAAYPSGLCAERVALFSAKSRINESIKTIAIVASNAKGESADAFACGNCRQVMMEYANQEVQKEPIRVIMRNHQNEFLLLEDVRNLLPFTFSSTSLG